MTPRKKIQLFILKITIENVGVDFPQPQLPLEASRSAVASRNIKTYKKEGKLKLLKAISIYLVSKKNLLPHKNPRLQNVPIVQKVIKMAE